jgi:4'-phosphopantetheinyl transferase
MDVYWLEQTDADVPAQDRWLSAKEILTLGGMRFAKRRNDWRLGRWTAKLGVAAYLDLPCDLPALANVETRSADSGAPEVFLFGQAAAVTISLSHRAGTAMCAVALPGPGIGCDLEMIEPRSQAFVTDYFTAGEQALVERTLVEDQPLLVTLLWSAKESTLKALRTGLRLNTTSLEVSFVDRMKPQPPQSRPDLPLHPMPDVDSDGWRPLQVHHSGEQVFHGWWQHRGGMVRTFVSALPLGSPNHLFFPALSETFE